MTAAFAGLERRLVTVPGLPLPADWLHTCCRTALRSTALRTCYKTWLPASCWGLRKLATGLERESLVEPEALRPEPELAEASQAQEAQAVAGEALVEAAGFQLVGYRIRISRKRFR